jgi:hypothetical protein
MDLFKKWKDAWDADELGEIHRLVGGSGSTAEEAEASVVVGEATGIAILAVGEAICERLTELAAVIETTNARLSEIASRLEVDQDALDPEDPRV